MTPSADFNETFDEEEEAFIKEERPNKSVSSRGSIAAPSMGSVDVSEDEFASGLSWAVSEDYADKLSPSQVCEKFGVERQFLERLYSTMKGDNGKRTENGVWCGKSTRLHEISGNRSAGREAFCVLLERPATFFHP